MALAIALAVMAAACGGDGDAASTAEGAGVAATASVEPVAPSGGDDPDDSPAEQRTVGGVGVKAATAPEWQANAGVWVPSQGGTMAFAQILAVEDPFELTSVEIETQGVRGAGAPVVLDAEVSIRLVPDGRLPEALDVTLLPSVGSSSSSVRIEPYDPSSGEFPEMALEEAIDVPAGRVAVILELRSRDSSVEVIRLTGRRGSVDGADECADHNPRGMFLRVAGGETGTEARLEKLPSSDGGSDCADPAPFNITLRLRGAALSESAAATLVSALPDLPDVTDLIAADELKAPPTESATPTAPAPPADGPRVQVATWPLSHRQSPVGLAGYWWGPSAFAEVAQSLLVEKSFELTELRFGVHRVSATANWETVPEEVIAWQHDVVWSGTVSAGRFRVTIWPLDSPGGETLDMAGVAPITEQMTVADIPIANYYGSQSARLKLTTPVRLEPGHYLVSMGIDGFGDPNAFNLYVIGRSYGYTNQTGYFRNQGSVACDYPAPTSDYPHGRLYARVFSITGRPTLLENATTVFREHRAKVLSPSLNECRVVGEPDYFLPGDLELTLVGRD